MFRQCINKATGKQKKTFDTLDEAIDWAKKMNKNPKFIHKQVAYKCKKCFKYHTGKSPHGTLLEHDKDIYKNG